MKLLVPASSLTGRPVVTCTGDDVGEVKDVVLGLQQAALIGFTLRKRSRLGGPLDRTLPWQNVHAVGDSAVMIDDEAALTHDPLADDEQAEDVIDVDVLTDAGDRLGVLTDVVIETGRPASVVGFEIAASTGDESHPQRQFLPIDEMVAVSGRALVVPDRARQFIANDLSGFGAGVDDYRHQLEEDDRASQ